MPSINNVIPLPTVASPNIEEIIQEFLNEEARRIKPATLNKYKQIADLLMACLNECGHLYLNRGELVLYDRFTRGDVGESRDFCRIFGADKLPDNTIEFLGYYLIHRIRSTKEIMKSGATVIKRLSRWLEEKGYAERRDCREMHRIGSEASQLLPRSYDLTKQLTAYVKERTPRIWDREMEDMFVVERIEGNKLRLAPINLASDTLELSLDERIASGLEVGWQLNLLLGKTPHGWEIIKVGDIFPLT